MNHELQWELGVGRRESKCYKIITDKLIAIGSHMVGVAELGQTFIETWTCPEKRINFIVVDYLLDGADLFEQAAPKSNQISDLIDYLDKL